MVQWFIFCDKMMFLSWVPFIQMHMVINILLNLLIGTWPYTKIFIMERTMWLFINKKIHLLVVMDF
jgi:hypothetical protein